MQQSRKNNHSVNDPFLATHSSPVHAPQARAAPTPVATSSAAAKKGFNFGGIMGLPSGLNLSLIANLQDCASGVNYFFEKC